MTPFGAALLAALLVVAPPGGPVVDRRVTDPRIPESSGLATSPRHAGVLWTHDDSGNPPLLFALAPTGAVAATVKVQGVPDTDWEAMAAFRDGAGRSLLAVADIGDNEARRREVEVDVVGEPDPLRSVTGAPLLRLRLTYPDGPHDAETVLVDTRRGRMLVVTKGLFSGGVYAVPREAWSGTAPAAGPVTRVARLVPVGTVPLTLVTDGTVTPSGAVLLRTYGELAAFDPFPLTPGSGVLRPRATAALPEQQQGEGLALAPGGRAVLLSSEGRGQSVLRVPLPPAVLAALTPSAPAPTPPASSAAPVTRAASARGSSRAVAGGAAGVLAALAVALFALLLRRAARRRSRRSA